MNPTEYSNVEKTIRPLVYPNDWIAPANGEDSYGPNQVIAAFQAGFLKAGEQAEAIIENQKNVNLQWSGAHTRQVIDELRKHGLNPVSARLRITDWNFMEVLFVLKPGETSSEDFLQVLDFVSDLKESSASNVYSVDFHFCEAREQLDETAIEADGYWRHHNALEQPA